MQAYLRVSSSINRPRSPLNLRFMDERTRRRRWEIPIVFKQLPSLSLMPSQNRSLFLIVLFASTLFSSALLMFVLQPLFGKLLLPLLGGTPAVWNSCMVFYQSVLFLGYLYAHLLGTRLNSKVQITVHLIVIALSFLALPVGLPENLSPPQSLTDIRKCH